MEIITNIMMLFSKELCGFSVGDYVNLEVSRFRNRQGMEGN